jgi:hypothetical protein
VPQTDDQIPALYEASQHNRPVKGKALRAALEAAGSHGG